MVILHRIKLDCPTKEDEQKQTVSPPLIPVFLQLYCMSPVDKPATGPLIQALISLSVLTRGLCFFYTQFLWFLTQEYLETQEGKRYVAFIAKKQINIIIAHVGRDGSAQCLWPLVTFYHDMLSFRPRPLIFFRPCLRRTCISTFMYE